MQELLWKRQELKDRKKAIQEETARIDADISALDRAIQIWEPDFSPTTPIKKKAHRAPALDGLFANDNFSALLLECLRKASDPISTHDCAVKVAAAKDIAEDDPRVRAISDKVSTCLSNLASRGRVERAAVDGRAVMGRIAG